MILINKTMETITEESAECGEAAEQWIEYEKCRIYSQELARDLQGLEPSQLPITNPEFVWFTSCGEMDYRTGNMRIILCTTAGTISQPASLKHWITAIRAAGFNIGTNLS